MYQQQHQHFGQTQEEHGSLGEGLFRDVEVVVVVVVVREGAEPAGATGVFVLPPQVEAGWRDVASPPFSMVPSTLASFQRRR